MSMVRLSKEVCLEVVTPDGDCFNIWAADDCGVYIEAEGQGELDISVDDDNEATVQARGPWATIKVYRPEED